MFYLLCSLDYRTALMRLMPSLEIKKRKHGVHMFSLGSKSSPHMSASLLFNNRIFISKFKNAGGMGFVKITILSPMSVFLCLFFPVQKSGGQNHMCVAEFFASDGVQNYLNIQKHPHHIRMCAV
jgi:hypothetical protein